MALQHLRSGTAHKRPIPTVMSAGQLAINTNEASPGLFFKDSNGDLVKVGPVHIGTDAPNSSPDSVDATALVTGTVYQILTIGTSDFTAVGASANTVGVIFTATGTTTGTGTVSGQQGVEKGEMWLDTTGGSYVLKIYDGTAWRSEAGEFVNTSGDTITGDLVFNNANIVFEGATADDYETTLTVVEPTADRTLSLPNVTGTLVSTGDTATVTSAMIDDGAGSGLDADKLDGQHGSSFLRSNANDSASGNLTFNNGISTAGEDVYLDNGTLIANDSGGAFSDRTGTNIDHIWHDETNNAWNFCSDTTYKATGNSQVKAGSLDVSGSAGIGGELNMIGSADADKILDARIGSNTFKIRKTTGGDAGHESLFEADGDGGCRLYFNNATKLETTTSGATVTGTCTATTFSGSGASLTSLNASNISSGTVNTARLPNTYTKAATVTIQATGAANDVNIDAADHIILEAGEEEDGSIFFRGNSGADSYRFAKSGQTAIEGFLSFQSLTADRTFTFPNTGGTIALTTSDISGDITGSIAGASDYNTLLRSNADDSFSGTITGNSDGSNPVIIVDGAGPNIIRFPDNGSNTLGIDLVFRVTPHTLGFEKSTNGTKLWETDCDTGVTQFHFNPTVSGNTIWHAGNDGTGSGLDADTLDGQQGSYYLNTATNFGGDVSGTYNAIVIANDSHTHSFANLTNKGTGTGNYSTDGIIESGRGSGGVALTVNDGYGNANVTFNHVSGTPEQNGKAGRIEVNTDSTSGDATMSFELGDATANTAGGIDQIFKLSSGTSEFTNNAGLTFSNRPAFNGGTSGSSSPFTVDSTDKVVNLNADLLDGISSGSFLRSDANDTCSGEITFSSGIKVTGAFSGDTQGSELVIEADSPTITFSDTGSAQDDFYIHVASNNFYVLSDRDGVAGSWDSPHPLQLEADTNTAYTFGNRILTTADEGSGNGLDADSLDGVHASSFLRSNASDTATNQITFERNTTSDTDYMLWFKQENANGRPQLRFSNNVHTQNGYFYYKHQDSDSNSAGNSFHFDSDQSSLAVIIDDTGSNSGFYVGTNEVWHQGNDGSGSGLDADTLDGIQSGSFLRSDANDTMTGRLTIDRDNDASGALRITANQTNPNNDFYFAQEIVSTLSGTTATTADREQGGIWIDVNSSATGGDTNHEHRAYGIYIDLDSTGDADNVIGIYSDATATPTTGTASEIAGLWGRAEDNGGAGATTNLYGVRGEAVSDNSDSDPNNLFGGWFRATNTADTGNIGSATGIYAEIEIPDGSGDHYGNSYVVRAVYDDNDGVAQSNTTYLFHGDYQGTNPTNAYGVYIADPCDNYFAGSVEIGTNLTVTSTLSVRGAIDLADGDTIRLGSSDDWTIYRNSNNWTYINDIGNGIIFQDNGSNKMRLEDSGIFRPETTNTCTIGSSSYYWDNGYFQDFNVSGTINVRGAIDLADSDALRLGSDDDAELFHTGTNLYLDVNEGNFHIRDGTTDRFIFDDNGDFTAKGDFFTFGDGAGAQTMRIVCDDYDYWDIKSRVASTDSLHIRAYNKGAIGLYTNGVQKLATSSTGITVYGTVNETSDSRYKSNIERIVNPLDKVNQLNGVTYNWTADDAPGVGVIAQDVEKVFPELVEIDNEGEEDEVKTVTYSGLIGLLVESVKELSETVTQLRAEVNELKGNA